MFTAQLRVIFWMLAGGILGVLIGNFTIEGRCAFLVEHCRLLNYATLPYGGLGLAAGGIFGALLVIATKR